MNWIDGMMRIVLSIILDFFIRSEQQMTGHGAESQINILIAMDSCLFLMFPIVFGSNEVYRIASPIVSGAGFLCGGVIFKGDGMLRGLYTAATLWCTAAIGVLASFGNCLFAAAATGILILSNLLFRPLVLKVKPATGWQETEQVYRISVICRETWENEIRSLLLNGNTAAALCLNHSASGDAIGDQVEVIVEYSSQGIAKSNVRKEIVRRALQILDEGSAGWEVLL